jgi:hypothetical protein
MVCGLNAWETMHCRLHWRSVDIQQAAHCRQVMTLSRRPLPLYKHQTTNCAIPVAHCKHSLDAEHENRCIAGINWCSADYQQAAWSRQLVTLSRWPLLLFKHQMINCDILVAHYKCFWMQHTRTIVLQMSMAQCQQPTDSTLQTTGAYKPTSESALRTSND